MKLHLFVVVVMLVTALSDYFLKLASVREQGLLTAEFSVGAALYTLTAVGWMLAMRHMTLASLGVYAAMLSLLFLTAMGTLVFREALSARDALGIACAMAAIMLVGRAP